MTTITRLVSSAWLTWFSFCDRAVADFCECSKCVLYRRFNLKRGALLVKTIGHGAAAQPGCFGCDSGAASSSKSQRCQSPDTHNKNVIHGFHFLLLKLLY
uniref:Putative secreted protein n=1 Tax=Ixodes ricinus TaxID=34613 RepID=A0A6B0U628_IXORI